MSITRKQRYPKMMRRIGLFPKLSAAELRAIAYAKAAQNLAFNTAKYHKNKKREAA